jgi:hypothetical protein
MVGESCSAVYWTLSRNPFFYWLDVLVSAKKPIFLLAGCACIITLRLFLLEYLLCYAMNTLLFQSMQEMFHSQ